ncbi:LysR substrate-binding domain-containing protein [Marilutibacter chinensis]|uniref:LysR substrate-binding domain-containing protein n=1 Tax=Marilutibacter chinensis TaxID=2912247 RepID=A0ABS9HRF3_9GAMM|nr:LysR substrate-binding domain-containing protein [Lysobacter chinensis]MCF7220712.1 LysR substrate-binding domain-containing protein [Lysobacter chinensis]
MALNLNDLTFFVAAVEQGGFAAASRRLGLPKSTVSKRVAALEDALSIRLIHRTSRSFTLTELGRDFYEHARAALIEAEAAEAIVRRRQAEPSGTVRITASVPVAQSYLADALPLLARRHPKLQLQLDVTDRFVDVQQEGFDIAVRSHFSPLPDSGLVQRQLLVEPVVLVASAAYLAQRGVPLSPDELQHHDGLLTAASATTWTLFDHSGERLRVQPHAAMIANESTVLAQAAIEGLGITCLPEGMCRAALASAALTRVLPEWNAGTVTTTLVMPHRRGLLPGVRATVEFLVQRLQERKPPVNALS